MQQRFRIALLSEGETRMTCREAQCDQYARGWMTVLDERTGKGMNGADYIRRQSGRRFVEFRSEDAPEHLNGKVLAPGLTVFKFYAGQQCFQHHADREVLFLHEQGGRRRAHRPRDWNEHFNEESAKAAERV